VPDSVVALFFEEKYAPPFDPHMSVLTLALGPWHVGFSFFGLTAIPASSVPVYILPI
jgi:hypothetical protein